MISTRLRNCLLGAHTGPGADCYSDHIIVIGNITQKIKDDREDLTELQARSSVTEDR